ncbi:MAG: DUF3500 domain-containing protein [Verrucomicrobia bacterium]|jgi:hypothetical protein|nr:DUF3500 domain-containing protein [Verrucomicrobiota bacterium]
MKSILLTAIFLLGSIATDAAEKNNAYQAPVTEIRHAAAAFLQSLSPELREQATFSLDDKERRAWSNLPATSFKREGVSFKEMSPEQRSKAHQLLQSTLSSQGYLKTTGIMHLDEILKSMAAIRRPNNTPMFGHDLYWIGIFGNPQKDATWGWQLDGHHLALNITVVGNEVAVRPAFMGSDPARLPEGVYSGWNVQGAEDEKGKRFFESLSEAQRTKAIVDDTAPRDVITGPTRGDQLKTPVGLPVSDLDPGQLRLFMSLLDEYVHNYEHNIAHIQMDRILKAGLDKIHFAWAGTKEKEPYYYRIHGPTVIIEFDNHYPPGRSSGPVNHIHSVFREPGNDYGDLLRKHLLESPHHQESK